MLIVIVAIIGLIMGSYSVYGFLKPYLKTKEGRKSVVKWYSILMIASIGGYLVVFYMMKMPDYFEQGIKQLHDNKYVKNKIDDFSSYTYRREGLPKETDNPTVFQVELNGDSLKLYLTCTMLKKKDDWRLIKIKVDSVTKENNLN